MRCEFQLTEASPTLDYATDNSSIEFNFICIACSPETLSHKHPTEHSAALQGYQPQSEVVQSGCIPGLWGAIHALEQCLNWVMLWFL
uniref:Uncharacterized protein n=1 Tax=Anguilla anguilla TaxID=7936 RepID=A0A0E9QML6_ANGAN